MSILKRNSLTMLACAGLSLALASCASDSHKSLTAKYRAMDFPIQANDLDQLNEPDFVVMAQDRTFEDMAVYRVKVLPADATNQRVYRLHLFLPSGPALWVSKSRDRFGKRFDENTEMLNSIQTQALLDVVNSSGVMSEDGRCTALDQWRREGGEQRTAVHLNGVMLSFDMVIRGQVVQSECALGIPAPVAEVAEAFARANGEKLPQ